MILSARDISKSYRGRKVVNNISIEVNQGEIVGLLGPNGAGKTTSFYMIVGIIKPEQGDIFLENEVISSYPMYQRAQKGIGYLAQEESVFRKLSVEDNILGVLEFSELSKNQQKELSGKIKEVTGGIGANVIYDPVGSHYSEPALRAIAWEGRYLVIGFAAGDIPKIPLNLALLKGCQIVGVFWGAWTGIDPAGNKANFMELFKLHGEGKISPEVSDKFTLDNAADAIAHLQNRKAKGKVIITI